VVIIISAFSKIGVIFNLVMYFFWSGFSYFMSIGFW